MLTITCVLLSAELKEEHIECNALRLRLSMHEAQAVETQQQLQRLHSEQQRSEAFSLGEIHPLITWNKSEEREGDMVCAIPLRLSVCHFD